MPDALGFPFAVRLVYYLLFRPTLAKAWVWVCGSGPQPQPPGENIGGVPLRRAHVLACWTLFPGMVARSIATFHYYYQPPTTSATRIALALALVRPPSQGVGDNESLPVR
jgi:hypothetical protein